MQPMGWTSEMVAEAYKVSRQKQDKYALISHERANKVLVTLSRFLMRYSHRTGIFFRHLPG